MGPHRSGGGSDSSWGDVNAQQGSDGMTALHLSAIMGHHDVVDLLLRSGANVAAANTEGQQPLLAAVSSKDWLW